MVSLTQPRTCSSVPAGEFGGSAAARRRGAYAARLLLQDACCPLAQGPSVSYQQANSGCERSSPNTGQSHRQRPRMRRADAPAHVDKARGRVTRQAPPCWLIPSSRRLEATCRTYLKHCSNCSATAAAAVEEAVAEVRWRGCGGKGHPQGRQSCVELALLAKERLAGDAAGVRHGLKGRLAWTQCCLEGE